MHGSGDARRPAAKRLAVEPVLAWLLSLPSWALYTVLGAAAAVENVFPPFPADTVVAFGSFLAARGDESPYWTFLATWAGNVLGAMAMYVVGRRYGAGMVERHFSKGRQAGAERRFRELYGRYGLAAVFITRFLPGVRALVPPLAGAFKVPPVGTAIMIALASAIWYGIVTYLGYQVGSSWEALVEALKSSQRVLAMVAAGIVVLGAVVWFALRARRTPAS